MKDLKKLVLDLRLEIYDFEEGYFLSPEDEEKLKEVFIIVGELKNNLDNLSFEDIDSNVEGIRVRLEEIYDSYFDRNKEDLINDLNNIFNIIDEIKDIVIK